MECLEYMDFLSVWRCLKVFRVCGVFVVFGVFEGFGVFVVLECVESLEYMERKEGGLQTLKALQRSADQWPRGVARINKR